MDAAHVAPESNGHQELSAEARCRLLLEISHTVRGTLDLRETLDRLLDGLQLLMPFDAGGIFVLREEVSSAHVGSLGEQIAGVSWRGFTPRSPFTDPMMREGRGIIGHVIRTGEAVCAPDVRLDARYIKGRDETMSEVAVPIRLDGRTIGALNLESDRLDTFQKRDVEILRFFADATAIAVEKAMLHERLVEAGRLERQLKTAQLIQERLLPTLSPVVPGHELAGLCMPSAQVGGDYFDYIPLANGQLGLVVADVSGTGSRRPRDDRVPGARAHASARGHPLDEVACTINRELPDSTAGSAFVTALLAVLDPTSGRCAT
jgi:GAF domain-containing protein